MKKSKVFLAILVSLVLAFSLGAAPVAAFAQIENPGAKSVLPAAGTGAPKKVTNVKAVAKSTSSIKVSWKKAAKVNGYEVYRATSKAGKYTKAKTVTNPSTISFTDKGLKAGKTYYYKVRAYKNVSTEKVRGSFSAVVQAKTKLEAFKDGDVVTVKGTVKKITVSDPGTPAVSPTAYILVLDTPVTFKDPWGSATTEKEIHIWNGLSQSDFTKIQNSVGKKVTVTGTVMEWQTAHHQRPMCIPDAVIKP